MKHRLRARFRLQTILQVALLMLSGLLLAWSIYATEFLAVPVVLAVIILLQVAALVRSVESHVDTLEDFFAAVNYEDFTRRYVEDDVDAELKGAFNRVLARFQDARAERDVQAGYLQTVVRHVPVPFIVTRADGSISLVNNPARRLTGLSTMTHIDQLEALDPKLPSRIRSLEAGTQQLIETRVRGIPAELRVSVSEIRLDGGVERLYSIENLSGELTARESTAWRNLIRVLTHEIMNTLTPVTSLAQTTTDLLANENASEDIRDAVQTIARRSDGLMNFVSRYRELLKVPQPELADVNVETALRGVVTLMAAELEGVETTVDVSPASLQLAADQALLDQVLVNVLKNALDAVRDGDAPRIALTGGLEFGRAVISIVDNGSGIDADSLEQVFVPFFTTRRDGSGIGLSLCRQIMTAHGGEIAIESDAGGTTVKLVF